MRRVTRLAMGSGAAVAGIVLLATTAASQHGNTNNRAAPAAATGTIQPSDVPPISPNHGLTFGPAPMAPQGTTWIDSATALKAAQDSGVRSDATSANTSPLVKLVTYTDVATGKANPVTGGVDPTLVNKPAWIVVYPHVPVHPRGPRSGEVSTTYQPLMFVVDAATGDLLEIIQTTGLPTS